MNYDLYLFSNLLKFYDAQFEAKPYDEQYDLLPSLIVDFENSEFSRNDINLYDCMDNYLKNKYSKKEIDDRDEIHFEVVRAISEHDNEEDEDKIPMIILSIREEKGVGGLWELATDLTDEFINSILYINWDVRILESFLSEKLK